jgi:DNA replication initiation complex subunit (GINS family)
VYNELYAAWRREISDSSLGGLSPDFYAKIAEYLRRMKEENKLIDKKSVKVNLLEHESENATRMLEDLLRLRYKKIIKVVTKSQKAPSELLTVEEAKMCESFITFTDTYQKFAKSLMLGQPAKVEAETAHSEVDAVSHAKVAHPEEEVVSRPEVTTHKRVTLRFTKSIPAIIGADMKSYGPFMPEDVASVPVDNAKMLVKQGLAVQVEVS